jgi:predicted RNA-binding protein with PUA-like domain
VDVKLVRRLKRPISLEELKRHKEGQLASMVLFKQSRLSVQPVAKAEWDFILALEDQEPAGKD